MGVPDWPKILYAPAVGRNPMGLYVPLWANLAGLNKGEARNALARALFFYRHGEIRDRTFENQRYRASGLNLTIAAITLWNTVYLSRAVDELRAQGEFLPDSLLAHIGPARLGTHQLQWRLRLAVRAVQGWVSAAAKSPLRVPRCCLAYVLVQILR